MALLRGVGRLTLENMRANRGEKYILLLVSAAQLHAQQVETNRNRLEEATAMAERGDPKSQFALAHMFDTGDGVQKDYAEAFKWYLKAAQNGHPLSQHMVGEMYRLGNG